MSRIFELSCASGRARHQMRSALSASGSCVLWIVSSTLSHAAVLYIEMSAAMRCQRSSEVIFFVSVMVVFLGRGLGARQRGHRLAARVLVRCADGGVVDAVDDIEQRDRADERPAGSGVGVLPAARVLR